MPFLKATFFHTGMVNKTRLRTKQSDDRTKWKTQKQTCTDGNLIYDRDGIAVTGNREDNLINCPGRLYQYIWKTSEIGSLSHTIHIMNLR